MPSSSGKGGVRLGFRIATRSASTSMDPVLSSAFSLPEWRAFAMPSIRTTYSLPIERAFSSTGGAIFSGRKTTCVIP